MQNVVTIIIKERLLNRKSCIKHPVRVVLFFPRRELPIQDDWDAINLTLLAPISQNGQTHSNNSSAIWRRIVWVFDHFVGLALKGLRYNAMCCSKVVSLYHKLGVFIWRCLLIFFSVKVKFGAYYITDQWGEFIIK